jgi:hypothetical protein
MSVINEEWRSISGFINYQVSNLGRLRNTNNGRIIKGSLSFKGYVRVRLTKGEEEFDFSLHRLVAQEFIENPSNKDCVDHIDKIRTNNAITNLRWVSVQENSMNRSLYNSESKSSKYKGVHLKRMSTKTNQPIWQAQIAKERKTLNLGMYRNEKDAARAYNTKAIELFGEYACINDISDTEEN